MVRARTRKTDSLGRYGHVARTYRTSIRRAAWRTRTKPQRRTLTAAEKRLAKETRQNAKLKINEAIQNARAEVWETAQRLWEEFKIHDVRYFYEAIMQAAKKSSTEREVNRWNAYLHMKTKERNTDSQEPGKKAHELSAEYRAEWQAMSKEEQIAITEDALQELKEIREMKKFSVQNVSIAAFHDSQATKHRIEEEITSLYARTAMEFIVIGIRTSTEHFNQPYSFVTSERLEEYFLHATGKSLSQFVKGLECFCLAGIDGLAQNSHDELNALKAKASEIILTQLKEIAKPDAIHKMAYKDFEERITDRYGIVVEGWPLRTFSAPGSIGSRPELTALIDAWESGTAKFRRLTPEELDAWKTARFAALKAKAAAAAAAAAPTSASPAELSPVGAPAPSSSSTEGSSAPTLLSFSTASSSDATTAAGLVDPPEPAPITTVFTVGTNVLVQKKPRKQRSDKGVKRGANARTKSKRTEGHAVSTPASR
ncbi:hypothetical protein EIP86_005359 [Pleurotus ostreatoroseus]|nr:hypothetical protein EIP86_005359 [Pleurotus ostreatoroseus]